MAGPPAICGNPHCAYVFEFQNMFGGPGGSRISLKGNSTRCPKCGSAAAIGDGEYQYSGGTLTLLDGPPLTRAMLERLSDIALAAKRQSIEVEQLLAEVADVSPELANTLRSRGLPLFVAVLVLIWLFKSFTLNITVDVNRLIDQALEYSAGKEFTDEIDPPLPDQPAEPSAPSPSRWADQQLAPMSRQVRRQLERQARKQQEQSGRARLT